MSGSIHEWDGAYVLGALSPEDRHRYEAHLAECPECARSVQDLAGLPGILAGLPREEALALRDLPAEGRLRGAHVPDRATAIARRIVRHRRRTRLVTAFALVGVLALGTVGARVLSGADRPAVAIAAAHEMLPVGDSHLYAELHVTPVGWGTRLDWSCDYRAPAGEQEDGDEGPMSYSLVVHTRTGATSTVATWTSEGGEAKGLIAATSIPADSIDRVEIRVSGTTQPIAETSI